MLKKLLKQRNKKGFTLIELIVVLVIMAILAAAAIPAMMGYVNNAKKAQYLANCRALYLAAQSGYTEARAADQTGVTVANAADAGKYKTLDGTTVAAKIPVLVPELAGVTIAFSDTAVTAGGATGYTIQVENATSLSTLKITAIYYVFGTGTNDFVSLTPGSGTNVMD